jgi:hypothetical protein
MRAALSPPHLLILHDPFAHHLSCATAAADVLLGGDQFSPTKASSPPRHANTEPAQGAEDLLTHLLALTDAVPQLSGLCTVPHWFNGGRRLKMLAKYWSARTLSRLLVPLWRLYPL